MAASESKTSDYLFDGNTYNDRERLILVHDYIAERHDAMLQRAHAEYGLAADGMLRALDVGCGEGLYLFHLASSKRFGQFEGWGIDCDAEAIETAATFIKLAGITGLHFAAHDAGRPFAEVAGIFGTDGSQRFDLVIASLVLQHLRQYRDTLAQMYNALKPGGTILIADSDVSPDAITYPHPSFAPLWNNMHTLMHRASGNVNMAAQHETLLAETGFQNIISHVSHDPLGGATKQGKALLEVILLSCANARPMIVERMKMMDETTFDDYINRLRSEATPQMVGDSNVRVTIGQKPL